ncbi:hypothetical protein [Shewanella woodyi]|uniref:hypothetical protein n=1 Tax=Shewanella woodyi TaxID=60961 RepID=UPI0007EA19E8|nr:hypothetical protein [Shewanella woodyi]
MKKLPKYLLPLILLLSSTMTLANECPDEHLPRYKGNSDFSIERDIKLNSYEDIRIKEWFLGRAKLLANQKRPSFQCQPKLLFTELLVKCTEPAACGTIEGLYQLFSENFHNYQSTLDSLPHMNYQATDRYCPSFECPWEVWPEGDIYLTKMLENWQSNSNIFTQAIKNNQLSSKAANAYIRIIGAEQLELNIQLTLDHVSKHWIITNILEVKRWPDFVLGTDYRGIKAYSVSFIGVEEEIFQGNEYWQTLHDLNSGLICDTKMREVQTLSPNGQHISIVASYNYCLINTTSI